MEPFFSTTTTNKQDLPPWGIKKTNAPKIKFYVVSRVNALVLRNPFIYD